ncbi:RNA polymerase sigma factor [Ruania alba]|uniref:RNA polymerase sigma-70 factor, ECF subfamily n=1 Tax=Ruania alba TaxID=648782 RepID=A0A1H5LCM9_9MICO|nr:sigma-70 family RNA polymerase sigma factor [Ruania alba]SEE74744.1 RNA polymerase sigma-70 factor, ECF subfamily [Ruania alba]
MEESEAWQQALRGDGEAFGHVFDQHSDRVYRHACRLVDSRSDAEDVTAAAFLELWRLRRRVRLVNGSVLPWLLVTASNVARNQRRATRRYRALLDRLPRSPESIQPDDGISEDLLEGLRSLSTPDLHLLCLVVLEGYQVAEAAELLGLSATAARSRLHRARARVREVAHATQVAIEEGS